MSIDKQALRNARSRTVTSSSAGFTGQLNAGRMYRIVGDVDFWYKFGDRAGSVAASANDAIFVPAGTVVFDTPIDIPNGNATPFLYVIRSSVDGNVNIAEVLLRGEVDEASA